MLATDPTLVRELWSPELRADRHSLQQIQEAALLEWWMSEPDSWARSVALLPRATTMFMPRRIPLQTHLVWVISSDWS